MTEQRSCGVSPTDSPAGVPGSSTAPQGPHVGAAIIGDRAAALTDELGLAYETGVEVEARSQWSYVLRRFLRHRLAIASLIIVMLVFLAGAFAGIVAPYAFDEQDFERASIGPTLDGFHVFGTDVLGRDYFSRVIFGVRTSAQVALIVAGLSTLIGAVIGAVAGYYGRWIDNTLMRVTDLFLVVPYLAVLLVAARFVGQGNPTRVAIILAFLFWTQLARIVRGSFLSLREKEYVEAAKASGSGDLRIMVRHILPNAMGPIIVNATLIVGTAILVEAVLAFLGFGVQPPRPALGQLIEDGRELGATENWWLVTFPGLMIVMIVLCINFVGDGLRDALDPTQRKVRA